MKQIRKIISGTLLEKVNNSNGTTDYILKTKNGDITKINYSYDHPFYDIGKKVTFMMTGYFT